MKSDTQKRVTIAVILTIFAVLLFRTAWISDDAAITLRTVLNFINGYGATFNISERVQAYTHPLWFFLISGFSVLFQNVFYTTFFLSIAISLLVVGLLTKTAKNFWAAVLAVGVLIFSKAYLDFATSGLENPLSHLLILSVVVAGYKALEGSPRRSLALTLFFSLCSLLYLNRPDLLLLVFPMALLLAFKNLRNFKALVKAIILGSLPALAWTLFSLYYYGFPFPNTAYAKLGTGIPLIERILQGLRYFLDSLDRDPLTLAFIAVSILIGLTRSLMNRSLAIGCALYLVYVVNIGGDFMSGRFFTAPLLVSALILAQSDLSLNQLKPLALGMAILAGIGLPATLLSNSNLQSNPMHLNGIADERAHYFQMYGLLTAPPHIFSSREWQPSMKRVAIVCGGLGFGGIQEPDTHFIDKCALSDPLLARLPAKIEKNWRVGHFVRQIPTDYEDSIAENANLLSDPGTREFYDSVRLITRAPLSDKARLSEIMKMNLGKIPKPDWLMYRESIVLPSSKTPIVKLKNLSHIVDSGPWNGPSNTIFWKALDVDLEGSLTLKSIDLSVDPNDIYLLEGFVDGSFRELFRIEPTPGAAGMVRHHTKLEQPIADVSKVRIRVIAGDGMYALGHFLINSAKPERLSGEKSKVAF